MKAADKKKWVAALRSGKYKQGQGRLCSTIDGVDRFCCLGVAADVLMDEDWVSRKLPTWRSGLGEGVEWLMQNRAGLVDDAIGLTPFQAKKLASLNDRNCSFTQIADVIEKDKSI